MTARSLEEEVDRAERSHLSPDVEADLLDQTYAAAFALTGKHKGNRTDGEVLTQLRRSSGRSGRRCVLT